MNSNGHNGDNPDKRVINRNQRIQLMRQQKKRQQIIRKWVYRGTIILGIIIFIVVLVFIIRKVSYSKVKKVAPEIMTIAKQDVVEATTEEKEKNSEEDSEVIEQNVFSFIENEATQVIGSEIDSQNAVLIDNQNNIICAKKNAKDIINPASMTKVLTILVVAKHIKNIDDTFIMTQEIADYCFKHDCSVAGFSVGENVSIKDLFYGAILPSGGEAALGLANYVAGSPEAFTEMMNEELKELGISSTAHFTNCIGIYDENHYCTVYDMAIIMNAAIENEFCREVLSAHTYTTSKTIEHPDGIIISNWFLRRIEDKDTGGEVIGGKTGYVVQSKNCAVSFANDNNGKSLICVTAGASSGWRCIYDHVYLYKEFLN